MWRDEGGMEIGWGWNNYGNYILGWNQSRLVKINNVFLFAYFQYIWLFNYYKAVDFGLVEQLDR